MHWKSRLGHVLELYATILAEPGSADGVANNFYRNRHYLGGRDRRWISEATWALVRGRIRWRHFALEMKAPELPGEAAEACRDLVTAWFAPEGFPEAAPDKPDTESDLATTLTELALMHEMPGEMVLSLSDWIQKVPVNYELFLASEAALAPEWRFGWPRDLVPCLESIAPAFVGESGVSVDEWVLAQTRAMASTAPVALRVNVSKISREACAELLAEQGVPTTPSALSPCGLLTERRVNMDTMAAFKEGMFEVQDEGSQLVAPVIAAGRPGRVLDVCAGAGGKSLHLATLLDENCEMYATDRDQFRLIKLRQRAKRAGVRNIHTLSMDTAGTLNTLDAVLIDAPCTGMGTLRRSPDRLWKVSPGAAGSYHRRQLQLLNQWAPFVRNKGLLVYVTCSFLPEENESVITAFLEKHPAFQAEDALDAWRIQFGDQIAPQLTSGWLGHGRQLLPGVHGCDGFFISCLRKKSA